MANVTRRSDASLDASTGMFAPQLTGALAGEDLDAAAPCYVHSDGLVYMSDGSADDGDARVHGYTPRAAKSGEPITLYGPGARFGYGSGLTPGAPLYVSTDAGRLADAPSTGGARATAFVFNATDIVVLALKAEAEPVTE